MLAAVLLSATALIAGCGEEHETQDLFEGEPVELGELQWNVLFSRFLNPYDVEDEAYLVGQPPPPKDAAYLGVFVQVINKDEEGSQPLPSELTVEDTERNEYDSIESESLYALHLGTEVDPEDQLPALDSTPQSGPLQGSLVLFLIPDDAAEDRPFVLSIPGDGGPATVELDL